jgi:regulator of replication initiation timing
MTEGVKPDVKVEQTTTVDKSADVVVPSYTVEETRAIQDGWKPKEDFVSNGGDESTWRSAREFNDRGELFAKIDDMKKELRSTKRNMGALKGHYDKVREVEFNRAIDTLKKQKKDALEDGDAQEVVDIDERIASTKEQMVQLKQEVPADEGQVHPAFQSWIDKNRWYERNAEMRDVADGIGYSYKNANPNLSPQEVLQYVTDKIAKTYPDQFKNPKRQAPNTVESGTGPRKVTSSFELSADERKVMNRLVSSGVMTEQKYIEDLRDLEKQGKR